MEAIVFMVVMTILLLGVGMSAAFLVGRVYENSKFKHYHVSVEKPECMPDPEFNKLFREQVELTIIKDSLAGYEENETSKHKWFDFYIKENNGED